MGAHPSPEFAIVGAGIVGLILAIGLVERGLKVRVYEQAQELTENGAGMAFTRNAVRCMHRISPLVAKALHSVATANGDPSNPNDHLQWVDGCTNAEVVEGAEERHLYRLHCGMRGFEGCHRAHLMEALLKALPEGTVVFDKVVSTLVDDAAQQKVVLYFADGMSTRCDAVIGCDGIKSCVRRVLLGENHPASHPGYTNKVAYRALIPMELAAKALGEQKARRQNMHIGPERHLLHFPVAHQTLVNVVAFNSDPSPWSSEDDKMVVQTTREEIMEAFSSWSAPVKALVSLFPPTVTKWAVFDSYDNPMPYYSRGRVCVAGDAAHAAAPHHGAGAGCGVEDVLCLVTAITAAMNRCRDPSLAVKVALNTFDDVRRQRSQWLVRSSRDVCDIYESSTLYTGEDGGEGFADIRDRSHKIWYFDYEGMLRDTMTGVRKRLL